MNFSAARNGQPSRLSRNRFSNSNRRNLSPQPQAQPVQQQQDRSADVNRQARRYLRNNADARNMNDNQLQARIRNGRNLLQQDGLRGKLKNQ